MPAGKRLFSASTARSALAVAVCLAVSSSTVDAQTTHPPLCSLEIRYRGDVPGLETTELVEVAVGEPVEPSAVRRTLANLHATGWFQDISWWLKPDPQASCLRGVLALESVARVRGVELVGGAPARGSGLRQRHLQRALRRLEGAALSDELVQAAVEDLRSIYRRRGYLEPEIHSEIRPGRVPWNDLIFRLESGPRAGVEKVVFTGETGPYSPEDLRSALKTRPGESFDAEKLENDERRLRRFLADRGHFLATVEAARTDYDPETDSIRIEWPVQAGPVFELEIQGTELRRLKRRGFLPFLEDRPFEDSLLVQTCARLRRHYQAKGYYGADIRCSVDPPSEPIRRISIEIQPGDEVEVDQISFTGTERVSAQTLRSLVNVGPGTWWSPGSGRLIAEELDADLERIRSFYLLEGFSQAVVGPARISETAGSLQVEIPIAEGPRRQVVGLELTGASIIDIDRLRARLPLKPGSGFHPLLLEDAVNLIRTLHEEEGYPATLVTPELDWDENGLLVDVTLDVDSGPERVLDRLVLRGLQRTRPELVRRFADLKPGDPLSRRRLLKAERDLYRLGIFSEVDVDLAPSAELSAKRDVRIRLKEGRRWRLAYGISYHSDDGIGGLFGLTRSNLRGRGERLQLDLRTSENDSRLRLIYDQPSLGPWRLPVTYTLFNRFEIRESYEVVENGTRVSLTRDLDRLRFGLVYDYRFVELSEEVLNPTDVEREDSEVEISSLAPNLFVDRRDDPLDPRRGWSTALQLEYAFPLFTAETELLKLFWQQTQYQSLGEWGTLAGSFRLGLIEPLSFPTEPDPIVPDTLPSSRVPISERFFAGGRTTHRAYERDRLGVFGESLIQSDTGELLEAGGNGLLLLNLDYRFPISGPVEGVTFLDVGNIWADWQDIDLGDVRPGMGLGVRYASPVGPIRLEIGWKLNPEAFEDNNPVFFLSFGNPF